MSLEVVTDSIAPTDGGEEYAGPDLSAESANVPRDSGIGPLPPSAGTSGGEYVLPSDLLRPPHSHPHQDEDEDDDEVLATLPIYLHHTLAPQLYQFQYPLQHRSLKVPTWAEERGKKISARVKEQSGRVDVEVPIDADPRVWRDERAKELHFVPPPSVSASSTPGPLSGPSTSSRKPPAASSTSTPTAWGDKMRLRSERVPISSATTYYSGLIHDNALHLHPISRMLQFRTELGYLDGSEPPAPKTPQGVADDPNNDGSGSLKDFRNKMWAMAGREQSEPWVQYAYRDGEEGLETVEKLLIDSESKRDLEIVTRPLDYLDRE